MHRVAYIDPMGIVGSLSDALPVIVCGLLIVRTFGLNDGRESVARVEFDESRELPDVQLPDDTAGGDSGYLELGAIRQNSNTGIVSLRKDEGSGINSQAGASADAGPTSAADAPASASTSAAGASFAVASSIVGEAPGFFAGVYAAGSEGTK